jgi:DNA-binding response OmpR family regulator
MKLLLVEDDALLGDGVRAGLKQAGFAVDWVQDGLAAKVALDSEEYDLLVLDLGLPKLSGMDLLKSVRAKRASLPVLILTARDKKLGGDLIRTLRGVGYVIDKVV